MGRDYYYEGRQNAIARAVDASETIERLKSELAVAIHRAEKAEDEMRYLSLNELSHVTKLPSAWLRRTANEGKLPFIMVGRSMMFNQATASAALKALQSAKQEAAS